MPFPVFGSIRKHGQCKIKIGQQKTFLMKQTEP
jgi:hypothetical protein